MSEANGRLWRANEIREKSGTFSHPWNDKSAIHGFMLARATGLKRSGVSLARLAPGKESFVYHLHHFEEEWIYILSGRGVAEIDGAELEVGPGDFMGFPTPSVVADFPKLGKRMVRRQTGTEVYDLASGKPFGPPSG